MGETLLALLEPLIKVVIIVGVIKLTVPFQILAERKISGWMQDRVGPNRCGPFGIIQPFADGLKLFFKEDFMPSGVDKVTYILGPCVAMFMAIAAFAVIPFGGTIEIGGRVINLQVASVEVGLLYILAIGALSVYGVVLGGWASNSKYSFLGGLRAAAQMISYEVPMGLAVITMVMICGTLRLETIVQQQMDGVWYVCTQPLTFLVFLICIFAETNRAPFDLAECEQELVAGFHTEYSSMKFAMFFLGEYAHMIVASAFAVTLFFGGWHIPYWTWLNESTYWLAGVLRFGVFYAKIWVFICFYMWVRWTLPRFRYDQLMRLCWHGLVPLGITLVMVNAVIAYWPTHTTTSHWWQFASNIGVMILLLLASAVSTTRVAALNTPVEDLRRRNRHFAPQ